MRLISVRARDLRMRSSMLRHHRYLLILPLFVLVMLYGNVSWALQRHTLMPEQHAVEQSAPGGHEQSTVQGGTQMHTAPETQAAAEHATSPGNASATEGHAPQPTSQDTSHSPATSSGVHGATAAPASSSPLPEGEGGHAAEPASPEGLPEHGEEAAAHAEHGVILPQISPIPGVTFVETMVNLMEHELSGRTLGWRPNDIIVGRFTDNINNFQLGVLEALRFTTLRLKDSLTRMGDADAYDPDLEAALNLLMNRATLFWFPSAENSYREAVDHLKNFLVKLENGQRHFYYRSDNLLLLVSTYRDLLGNVNRNLIRQNVGWFESDDYFYYAKGVAHVYFEILKVVRVGFQSQLSSTLDAVAIMDELLHELWIAEQVDPWLVLNSGPDSFFANHRFNLNAPLSEVAHLLVVLSQF